MMLIVGLFGVPTTLSALYFCLIGEDHTRATPKIPEAPVTKKPSPTYSPEIQGWDFRWLELLEWLEAGG